MHLDLHGLSGSRCQLEQQVSVEKNSDNVLLVRDIRIIAPLKLLLLITVGTITLIAVLDAIISPDLLSVSMLILVLLALVTLIAPLNITEINLSERRIRRTWKIGALAWHRIYSLDDYGTAEIKLGGQLIEGYSLAFFSVYLAGTSRHIRIYSTDDEEDAMSVYGIVTGFLNNSIISTQKQQPL